MERKIKKLHRNLLLPVGYIRDQEPVELQPTKQRPTPRPRASKQQKLPVVHATKEDSTDDTSSTISEDSEVGFVLTVDSESSLAEDSDANTENIDEVTSLSGDAQIEETEPTGSASEDAESISSEDTKIDDDVPQDTDELPLIELRRSGRERRSPAWFRSGQFDTRDISSQPIYKRDRNHTEHKMGKVKRQRKKLHTEAVKTTDSKVEIVDMMDTDIQQPELRLDNPFANLDLDLGQLKQKLPDFDARSQVTNKSLKGLHIKKKDKKKLRHDIWIKKLNAVEAAKKEEKDRKKREKTAIVGDIGAMGDALPTIELLMKKSSQANRDQTEEKTRGIAKEKKRKKQMMEDISVFKQILDHPAYKENPTETITTHLQNKLKQEDAG
ncbi:unnamed protein product [Mytilus coruscus]|uniref:Protein FAM207A n=1 Tax=Mytilus coruscus TaxID=42192 RepID=A0A6J8CVJ4_MYTCO|nr:unnamed protein product [Mytilus coruscus]